MTDDIYAACAAVLKPDGFLVVTKDCRAGSIAAPRNWRRVHRSDRNAARTSVVNNSGSSSQAAK